MIEAPELLYHGKPLTAQPHSVNGYAPGERSLGDVQDKLQNHEPVTVNLEPGDATSYRISVVPNPFGGVSVIRHDDGGPCYAHHLYINEWEDLETVLLPIAHGNTWSATFLGWWLRQALGWEFADPAPPGPGDPEAAPGN